MASATLYEGMRVVRQDVDRPDHALDADELPPLVDADPLLAAHQQVAVGQALRHGHRDDPCSLLLSWLSPDPSKLRLFSMLAERISLPLMVHRAPPSVGPGMSILVVLEVVVLELFCAAVLSTVDGHRVAHAPRNRVLEQRHIVAGLIDRRHCGAGHRRSAPATWPRSCRCAAPLAQPASSTTTATPIGHAS